MNEGEIIERRLKELALRAYANGYYTFTNFLGIAEISMLKKLYMTNAALRECHMYCTAAAKAVKDVLQLLAAKNYSVISANFR